MIAFVRGLIEDITEDNVVIDTGSIGYNLKISQNTAESLRGMEDEVRLYTYTCVREDAVSLFGFLTKDDLEMFKMLITVNGIGPKGGLAVLSAISADELRFAILAGDARTISKAPGIGAKTASRVILDLKDKISLADTLMQKEINAYADKGGNAGGMGTAANEAVEALTALGYSAADALRAVKKAEIPEGADTEAVLKLALKNMF